MKMRIKRIISLVLALTLLLSNVYTPAFAADFSKLAAEGSSVELDGVNPGTATVTLVGKGEKSIYGIEGTWDCTEVEGTNYLELVTIESDIFEFRGTNYVDAESGKVLWVDGKDI